MNENIKAFIEQNFIDTTILNNSNIQLKPFIRSYNKLTNESALERIFKLMSKHNVLVTEKMNFYSSDFVDLDSLRKANICLFFKDYEKSRVYLDEFSEQVGFKIKFTGKIGKHKFLINIENPFLVCEIEKKPEIINNNGKEKLNSNKRFESAKVIFKDYFVTPLSFLEILLLITELEYIFQSERDDKYRIDKIEAIVDRIEFNYRFNHIKIDFQTICTNSQHFFPDYKLSKSANFADLLVKICDLNFMKRKYQNKKTIFQDIEKTINSQTRINTAPLSENGPKFASISSSEILNDFAKFNTENNDYQLYKFLHQIPACDEELCRDFFDEHILFYKSLYNTTIFTEFEAAVISKKPKLQRLMFLSPIQFSYQRLEKVAHLVFKNYRFESALKYYQSLGNIENMIKCYIGLGKLEESISNTLLDIKNLSQKIDAANSSYFNEIHASNVRIDFQSFNIHDEKFDELNIMDLRIKLSDAYIYVGTARKDPVFFQKAIETIDYYKNRKYIARYFYDIGDLQKCLENLNSVMENNIMHEILFFRSSVYIELKMYKEAINDLLLILLSDQKNHTVHKNIATCYLFTQKYDECIDYLEKALLYGPRNNDLINLYTSLGKDLNCSKRTSTFLNKHFKTFSIP